MGFQKAGNGIRASASRLFSRLVKDIKILYILYA